MDTIYSLRFPNLQLLYLGDGFDTNTLLTSFLIAHPKLSELSLCPSVWSTGTPSLSASLIDTTSFPTLRSFQGNIVDVTLLIRRQLQSLTSTLEDLTIVNGPLEYYELFNGALLAGFEGFNRLDTLRVDTSNSRMLEPDEASVVTSTLKLLGRFCPFLTYFEGSVCPTSIKCSKPLSSVFSGYTKVTRIDLHVLILPRTSLPELVRPIAEECKCLREIRVRPFARTPSI
ncbi:hypothetical protein ONZ45_g19168 [Pleurotus djamor]|nr:hypothetical protein ONZ45_g19168 [Pleurotus djamor]